MISSSQQEEAARDLIGLVITFALFGLPSNILVKRYGPKKVLPVLLMAVGGVLVGAGCCSNPAAWFALRLRR